MSRRLGLVTDSVIGFVIVLIPLLIGTHANAQVSDDWDVVFPTSESGAAQDHFLEGVTYMHLHMFEDAEDHFREAQRRPRISSWHTGVRL